MNGDSALLVKLLQERLEKLEKRVTELKKKSSSKGVK